MKILFRTDASLDIGSGHVMRCLTLAEALASSGADCEFIIRLHDGNLANLIQARGFKVHALPAPSAQDRRAEVEESSLPSHAQWLGVHWQIDARETEAIVRLKTVAWLVVDHYGLDFRWERRVAGSHKILVIDDLADRVHECDILLDQNLGRSANDYMDFVPRHCKVFAGADHALLRREFTEWRGISLQRRVDPLLKRIMIAMGGVDQPNATGCVLETLRRSALPEDCQIDIIMGAAAPWLDTVRYQAQSMPWRTNVVVNVSDMARRMTACDLIIGAAGSSSWERCCLGVPSIMVVLAENQKRAASALADAGCAVLVGCVDDIGLKLPTILENLRTGSILTEMSKSASFVCDGQGAGELVEAMLGYSESESFQR